MEGKCTLKVDKFYKLSMSGNTPSLIKKSFVKRVQLKNVDFIR